MHVPGTDYRGAETAGHTDRYPLLTEHCSDPIGTSEAVLDGQHDRVQAHDWTDRASSILDIQRFRRDDYEIAYADLGRIGGCV
jgi:hypothetical protein